MNFIDLIIVLVLIYYLVDGYRRGFLKILMELVIFLVSIMVAFLMSGLLGKAIAHLADLPKVYCSAFGFLLIWFIFQIGLTILKGYIGKFIPEVVTKSMVNKVGGVITSFVRGSIFITLILIFVVVVPFSGRLKNYVTKSSIGGRLVSHSQDISIAVRRTFGGSTDDMLTFFTVAPANIKEPKVSTGRILKPDETLELGFHTTNVKIDLASENRMLVLINEERTKRGLYALTYDSQLQRVARVHGVDMFARGYFAHIDPDKLDPFQRLLNAGIDYLIAGENLALAPTVDLAHNGLMNSPGHKANILEPKFGRAGIGVIDGGIYGKMFVQEFSN